MIEIAEEELKRFRAELAPEIVGTYSQVAYTYDDAQKDATASGEDAFKLPAKLELPAAMQTVS